MRAGNRIYVSGTTATDADGEVVGPGDAETQTRFALQNIESALKECDASLTDVVRTRMFVTDIDHWEAVARAHQAFFADIRPAATMVEVSRLIHSEMLVEIEVEAELAG